MAAEALRIDRAPARPSWSDRFIALPERLPGPALAWIAGIGALLIGALVAPALIAGSLSLTALVESAAPVGIAAYALSLIVVLRWFAEAAYRQSEPVRGETTDGPTAAVPTLPDRYVLPMIVVLVLFVTVGYLSEPSAYAAWITKPPEIRYAQIAGYWVALAAVALLVVHTVRQLTIVRRVHRLAKNVDLFEPRPLYGYGRLTAATATGFLLMALPFTLPLQFNFAALTGAGFVLLAMASFALPLRGLHDRLAGEKAELLREINRRLRATTERVHAAVDADDLSEMSRLHETIAVLIAERDLIGRLPTWPWSTATFRAFATAMLLPIAIFVLTRLIDRLL